MLPEIEGIKLPNPIWSTFPFEKVLQYYDGPRLLLQHSPAGQAYLAWWSDADSDTERWVCLPVSERRLYEVLSGVIPSREGIDNPEGGYVFVVDRNVEADSIVQMIMTQATALRDDSLPRSGARLNIPMPAGPSSVLIRDRAHLLDIRLESTSEDETGRISAKIMGLFAGNFQRLVDSVGQAKSGNPTSRGSIPDAILKQTRLDPIEMYSGSLGLRFETNGQDDLFGESLIRNTLEGLFGLLDVGDDSAQLSSHLVELKSRVAKNYKDWLSTIEASVDAAYLNWKRPEQDEFRQAHINHEKARNIIGHIEAAAASTEDNIEIEGTFTAGNVRTLRFEISSSDTGERFEGSIDEEAIDEIEKVTLGSPCRVVLQPQLQVNAATGEERTTYALLSIHST